MGKILTRRASEGQLQRFNVETTMSSSGGNNREALDLQKASLLEQQSANKLQLSFMEKQLAALRKTQVSPYLAAAPAPTPATAGADYASAQQRIESARRFGYNRSVVGGVRTGLGAAA